MSGVTTFAIVGERFHLASRAHVNFQRGRKGTVCVYQRRRTNVGLGQV